MGNGRSASFWFDVWTPLGQLIMHLGPLGPRALRIRKDVVVADATRGSNWDLPHPRLQQEVALHSYLTTISLPLSTECDDMFEWIAGDSSLCTFRSATTWEVLRPREETKDWFDVIWLKGSVPKLAFTMWVANYDRLPTRTRLASWGVPISADCPICSRDLETRDHIFLSCDYSFEVWREVLIRCNPPTSRFTEWSELLSWIRAATSKELRLLRKLATHTVIFHLWKHRNNLIHNQTSLSVTTVFHSIDREMKNIISANRYRKSLCSLMALWLR
ncbi:uncharacterized protein LOC106407939 [Brassica napus]|uniref:uncharacterized protein LOC106407939 n=1 Tax=Brassica napus TaxID=3708 RepID=UPI0006AA8C96|nr:uncharacterized protein LOC106407939 [Brassica napus]